MEHIPTKLNGKSSAKTFEAKQRSVWKYSTIKGITAHVGHSVSSTSSPSSVELIKKMSTKKFAS